MKYKIKDITEVGTQIRIIVEHDFGEDNFGLSIKSKKLDSKTDQPKFLTQIERLLEKKYGDNNRRPKNILNEYVGKEFDHKEINIGKAK